MAEEKKIDKKEEPEKKKGRIGAIKSIVKKPKKEEKTEKKEEKPLTDTFDVLKFVVMTEKAIQMIETQNKLVFIVNRKSNKDKIKSAAESIFESPVASVKTVIDQKGRKKAFIRLKKEGAAGEIAIRLGII